MKSRGFDVRQFYLRPAAMTHAWASGYPWENVIKEYGMAEGNLAMLMMRTADNLRHTANLVGVFPEAAATAREAIGLIMKEPVVEGADDEVMTAIPQGIAYLVGQLDNAKWLGNELNPFV
jgi:ATP-dependent RNA helicase HelY